MIGRIVMTEKVYVVRWECMSSDFYGHPSGGILGVFQTKKDAVIALENMSDVHHIFGWHSGGSDRPWRFYKIADDDPTNSECFVEVEDLVEWGIVPSNEVGSGALDLDIYIEGYEMGVLKKSGA